jgi:hypothetical protein
MEKQKELQQEKEKITKHKFFFEVPLYSPVSENDLEDNFDDFFDDDVEGYNPDGFETTFKIEIRPIKRYFQYHQEWAHPDFDNYYAITLKCKRKDDMLHFFIYANGKTIEKIGQNPSIADLQYSEIGKKYDKVLSKQDLHDLKKAIGLSSHGAGAGSLVYLRRIFENIIWETYKKYSAVLSILEDDFKQKRMDEKVSVLKDFLPEQLIEMKSAYGVLSKGIHELSEKECLAYFPVLKLSIELILDQKIEIEAKEKKDRSVKEKLKDIVEELKK